jgi:asparagine synthase (glutamine-hydrolysing)
MCGINGIFAYHYAANPIDRAELRRTRDHMAARGPDGTGEWISADERVGFGHQRLAIIDLSEAGMQPMATADGKFIVTYNGEVSSQRSLAMVLTAIRERMANMIPTGSISNGTPIQPKFQ